MDQKQIIYIVGLLPDIIDDGTADHFRMKGVTSAMLLADESTSYSQERAQLAALSYTDKTCSQHGTIG